eukprot:CAMPEP_0184336704 /NCGR_PEP_ID=MMETSP1089-20130417/4881_1 /TAXON_ID=38269 ORGANISM="Gloeochaete wittrockiana, Strain SAG46.84" /NCGR_SAMPLE_ID=MMETSP1089 /ASSEMBLY_ACC=CAM_ASM_000445 /LENGTH=207 /DNA_ID=CAMNT_0026661757 /DNA_START=1479 /DNA_END=2102 /DNA_ORIENTATION=-
MTQSLEIRAYPGNPSAPISVGLPPNSINVLYMPTKRVKSIRDFTWREVLQILDRQRRVKADNPHHAVLDVEVVGRPKRACPAQPLMKFCSAVCSLCLLEDQKQHSIGKALHFISRLCNTFALLNLGSPFYQFRFPERRSIGSASIYQTRRDCGGRRVRTKEELNQSTFVKNFSAAASERKVPLREICSEFDGSSTRLHRNRKLIKRF